jgi:predicted nuclease with TOPRIM domain
MTFWQNKINSKEYDETLKRISEVIAELNGLKARLSALETNESELRGKINKRLARMERIDDNQEKTPQGLVNTKNLNTFNPFS